MKNIIIVLNYNSFSATKRLVSSIYNYDNIDHIVIVDNASTEDDSKELRCLENKKISLVTLTHNDGYAAGNNAGIRFAINKFGVKSILFITNPDVKFTNDVLVKTNSFIVSSKNRKIGAVAPVMRDGNSAWKFTTFYRNIFLESGILPKLLNTSNLYDRFYKNKLRNLMSDQLKVDVVSGAFFALSAAAFIEADFFDEGTFLYYEEEILAKKLTVRHYSNFLLTNCEYQHEHNYSNSTNNLKTTGILNASRKYFFNEYFFLTNYKKILLKLSDVENIILAFLHDRRKKIR